MNLAEAEKNPAALKFRISGRPVPLARPRFGNSRIFDPQRDQKLIVGITIREQMDNRPMLEVPLVLFMNFYFDIPKRWSKKKQAIYNDTPHIFKPDLDNCIKWICDLFTGVCYADDCLVAAVYARKIYGEPRTEIVIIPWSDYEKCL